MYFHWNTKINLKEK